VFFGSTSRGQAVSTSLGIRVWPISSSPAFSARLQHEISATFAISISLREPACTLSIPALSSARTGSRSVLFSPFGLARTAEGSLGIGLHSHTLLLRSTLTP